MKNRGFSSKFVSMEEAAKLVEDSAELAMTGHMEMSPMSFIRELIRSGKRSLKLVCVGSAAINADLLIGAGAVERVEYSQITLGEHGLAPHFRRAFETGRISGLEHACPTMAAALQAGASGIPFMPVRGLIGTDYMNVRDDFRAITNPFDEKETIAVVPALRPDVAVFHAFQADVDGNVLASSSQNNRLLAQAAKRTIVTVEEVVGRGELSLGSGSFIPSLYLSAVVHAPNGAYPTGCPGYYAQDAAYVRDYAAASKSEQAFESYLSKMVRDPGNRDAIGTAVPS
ncbi:CoA transferase subunit A [Cohnella faecalis]|uniref:CoA transferase subunit A n=1 Tax=Cohnella faecalis TaxID=2315694 RepID=UPI001314B636|nr:CoA-transferase [Cohnella faecalis]